MRFKRLSLPSLGCCSRLRSLWRCRAMRAGRRPWSTRPMPSAPPICGCNSFLSHSGELKWHSSPQYVDARLASGSASGLHSAALQHQTSDLQRQMWAQAVAAAAQDPHALSTQIFLQALNEALDAQSRRDAARANYVPGSALYLLFTAAILAMGMMGYRSGLAGGQAVVGIIQLAFLLTLILLIILDLDHPTQGLIVISQQALRDLRQRWGRGETALLGREIIGPAVRGEEEASAWPFPRSCARADCQA